MVLFLASAFAADWPELHTSGARATSFLKSNWNKYEENYHPNYAFDEDPKTAWVEGVEGDGVGQQLEWPVSALRTARAVRVDIRNGYQKSASLLVANGAPKDVTVTLLDGAGHVAGSVKATLERKEGWQSVTVPATSGFNTVRLTIDSVTPGSKYRDTCISDVRTFVDSDVPYDAAFEEQKHQALLAWRAERLRTAAYFAKQPADYPWGAAAFRGGGGRETSSVDFTPWRAAWAALAKEKTWWRVALTHKVPVPDGLQYFDELRTSIVRWADASVFEASGATRSHSSDPGELIDGVERMGWYDERVSNAHILWADSARTRPRDVAWTVTYRSDGREVSDSDLQLLARYDDNGRLVSVYGHDHRHGDEACWWVQESLWTLTWDAAGHIVRVDKDLIATQTDEPAYKGAGCVRGASGATTQRSDHDTFVP